MIFNFEVEKSLAADFEKVVVKGGAFSSRSEAMRFLMREAVKEFSQSDNIEIAAANLSHDIKNKK